MNLVINSDYKEVTYFGFKLSVPEDVIYIATDKDNTVCGFLKKPELVEDAWEVQNWYSDCVDIGFLEDVLEEFSYKDSLVEYFN